MNFGRTIPSRETSRNRQGSGQYPFRLRHAGGNDMTGYRGQQVHGLLDQRVCASLLSELGGTSPKCCGKRQVLSRAKRVRTNCHVRTAEFSGFSVLVPERVLPTQFGQT
jgi:hypothetical protein